MVKTSNSQKIFAEIELFLEAGRYEDAKILLNFVDWDDSDRADRLYLLLINATIDGPGLYKDEIDQLASLPSPSPREKEIVRKILLLAAHPLQEDRPSHRSWTDPLSRLSDKLTSDPMPGGPTGEGPAGRTEADWTAVREPLAQFSASEDRDMRSLQETVERQAELLRANQAALDALEKRDGQALRSLESKLGEKAQLLKRREAELEAIGAERNHFRELARAQDEDCGRLQGELNRHAELLLVKDSAIKNLREHFTGEIRALEQRVDEQRNLLQSRDGEIISFIAKLEELNRQRAELISEREEWEFRTREELREKASLLQATATAIEELEQQAGANIAALEQQQAENRRGAESRDAELAGLRAQVRALTERLAGAEDARQGAEISLHDQRDRAPQAVPDIASAHDGDPSAVRHGTEAVNIASMPGQEGHGGSLKQRPWKPLKLPAAALPIGGAVLLIVPIVYLLSDQARTAVKPAPNPAPKQILTREPAPSVALPLNTARAAQKIAPGVQIAGKRDARPARARGYVTRRAVALRPSPRYAATATARVGAGTRISVLETEGNWLKVETEPPGAVGYLRKEYIVAQN